VTGGLWLWVGALILVITLLYWGREEMRNFDRVPAGGTAGAATGILPAPRGTPPEGVHMPPPSFRPLLVALGLTTLVAGMIVGGWGLFLGLIALVLVLLGWLWDARKEYVAVARADTTGHLDLGGAPAWPKATFAALALIVALAVLLTSGILPNSGDGSGTAGGSAAPGASAAPGGGGGASASAPAPSVMPDADVVITAQGTAFTTADVTLPASKPFKLAFDNRDSGVPHDVVIKDAAGAVVYKTEPLLVGPAVSVYDVPAIQPGQYTFVCTVHPNMQGTATAQQ
jgi:plastocyanin